MSLSQRWKLLLAFIPSVLNQKSSLEPMGVQLFLSQTFEDIVGSEQSAWHMKRDKHRPRGIEPIKWNVFHWVYSWKHFGNICNLSSYFPPLHGGFPRHWALSTLLVGYSDTWIPTSTPSSFTEQRMMPYHVSHGRRNGEFASVSL